MADEPSIARVARVDRRFALAVFALLLVTTLAYAPVLRAGLLGWDDGQNFATNPLLNPPSLDGLSWFWRHSHMHLYVPVTYTVWSALAWISHVVRPGGAMWPLPFHAANLATHLATVALVIAILRRLDVCRVPTLLAATLFALHPLNVEAVAWASGLKDTLSTALMFAAALAWVAPRVGPRTRRMAALATLLYALALLTKPTAIVTPLIAWLLAIAVGRPWRSAAAALVPWIVLAVPVAVIGRSVQPPGGEVVPIVARPLVALDAIGFYLAKLAWPTSLAVDHGRAPTRLLDGKLSMAHLPVAAAVLAALAFAMWRIDPPRRRRVAIAAAIAFVTLSPVLGLVPFDFQSISTVADHYCYPTMVGVAIAVATIASAMPIAVVRALTVAAALVFLPLTFRQARTWRDDESLFTQVLAANPRSWTAATAFSYAALRENRPADAERWATRALEQNNRYPTAWVNLASAQSRLGRDAEAIYTLGRVYEIEPDNAVVNLNLGGLLASKGELGTAMPLLQHAVDLDPTNAAAQGNLGGALLQTGRPREALERLNVAVRLAPGDPSLRTRRAIALDANGRPDAARRELNDVLAIDPTRRDARDALARLAVDGARPAR